VAEDFKFGREKETSNQVSSIQGDTLVFLQFEDFECSTIAKRHKKGEWKYPVLRGIRDDALTTK